MLEWLEFTCLSGWSLHTRRVGIELKCKSTGISREYWNFGRSAGLVKVARIGLRLKSLL